MPADEALMQMIADAAGLGDEQAQAQLDLLRARKLRERVQAPKDYSTPGAALGGGIADIIYGVRSGRDEARAQAAGSAADQKRNALVRALAGKTGMDAPQYRALSRALAGTGDPTLAAMGKGYETEAGALDKSELQAARAEADFLRKKYEVDNPPVRITQMPGTPDAGYYTTGPNQPPQLLGPGARIGPDGKPIAGPGVKNPQFRQVVIPGVGPVWAMWENGQWVQTNIGDGQPAAAPPPPGLPGSQPAATPPSPPRVPAAPPRPLPAPVTKEIEQDRDTIRSLELLTNTFQDRFAGQGMTGNLAARTASFVGDTNAPIVKDTVKDVELANWYKLLQLLKQLPERRAQAGVAVTPLEDRLFRAAQVIDLSMPPVMLRQEFARLLKWATDDLNSRMESSKAGGYAPAAVDAAAGRGSGVGATVQMRNPKGAVGPVPVEKVEAAKRAGYVEVK